MILQLFSAIFLIIYKIIIKICEILAIILGLSILIINLDNYFELMF